MRFNFAVLAKFADITPDGLFHTIGAGFNSLATSRLPIAIPTMAILVNFFVPAEECDADHLVGFQVYNPDGSKHPIDDAIPYRPKVDPIDPSREVAGTCVLGMFGTKLEQEGDYEIRISDGDTLMGSITLRVILKKDKGTEQ